MASRSRRSTTPTPAGAATDVTAKLLAIIEDSGLQPGDRLPVERDLAAQLGVSRSTVREAIRTLSSMGMLAARQGSGTYITELSAERLATPLLFAVERNATSASALMDVRGMLEVGATELAAPNLGPADIRRLRRLAAAIDIETKDGVTNLAADHRFHRAIHELADNELLLHLIDSVWYLAAGLRQRVMQQDAQLRRTVEAHDAIIDALETRDPVEAGRAMRAHIEDIRRWLAEAIALEAERDVAQVANGQSNP
jgi:GntR family transcriptional repressor for pyruvate dehydrogenase complex